VFPECELTHCTRVTSSDGRHEEILDAQAHGVLWCSVLSKVQAVSQAQMASMIEHEEFESLSIDATCQVCLRLDRQASYRAPASVRAEAAFDDASSYRRLLTVRGRTGGVLLMQPVREEKTVCIEECMASCLPLEGLAQVRFAFSDDPSTALFQGLKRVCPSLEYLALDPTHLAIVYEYATWRKRTAGSRLLRVIMAKFSKVDRTLSGRTWGPPFQGIGEKELDHEEQLARSRILDGSMPRARALRTLETMSAERPFASRVEFLEALAALSCLHPEDMKRKVTGSNKEMSKILWCAATATRVEWYFNNQRIRHSIASSRVALLAVGTMSNESLHAEINVWFRTIQKMHQATLFLKCQILTLKKQLAHCSALYWPTLKQVPPSVVLARVLANPVWTNASWRRWCSDLLTGGSLAQGDLPMNEQRRAQVHKVAEHMRKRPAAPARTRAIKRTPFSLKRQDNLIRGGVKHSIFKKHRHTVGDVSKSFFPVLPRDAADRIYKRPAGATIRKKPAGMGR